MSSSITRVWTYYGKMMKETIEGGTPDSGQGSGHVSDGKYVEGKVKEQEESDRKAGKRKTDIREFCFLNLEGEHKVLVKTILVL